MDHLALSLEELAKIKEQLGQAEYAFKTAMKYVDQAKTGPDLYHSMIIIHKTAMAKIGEEIE